ncbi:hypothetical protein DSO57_1035511 [Entomophthora muscae]|uniref:Uncharacterized protein n=1 Tax=Entomophthora muscae TaxID=34485 RepID=A0ACC2SCD8_9FUNG|nr:hypothetical protein DSO57_1035511 [Entomophthora muscae]
MIIATTAISILIYGIVASLFLAFEDGSPNPDDQHCYYNYIANLNSSEIKGCFMINHHIQISKNQGWVGTTNDFNLFHHTLPHPAGLPQNCQHKHQEGYILDSLETFYSFGTITTLGSMECPKFHYCLLKAYFSNKKKVEPLN